MTSVRPQADEQLWGTRDCDCDCDREERAHCTDHVECLRKRAPGRIGADPRKGAISKCPTNATIECLAAATGCFRCLAAIEARIGLNSQGEASSSHENLLTTDQVSQRYLATTVSQ